MLLANSSRGSRLYTHDASHAPRPAILGRRKNWMLLTQRCMLRPEITFLQPGQDWMHSARPRILIAQLARSTARGSATQRPQTETRGLALNPAQEPTTCQRARFSRPKLALVLTRPAIPVVYRVDEYFKQLART